MATAAATTRSTPTIYLFAASHDWEGSRPALKTNSEDATADPAGDGTEDCFEDGPEDRISKVCSAGSPAVSCSLVFEADAAAIGRLAPTLGFPCTAANAGTAAAEAAPVTDARCAAGTGALPAADCAAANACTSGSTTGLVTAAAPKVALFREAGFSCPRHFFSSHSTQSMRPADTGKPQASHLRRLLNTGGTWLWSGSSAALSASAAGFTAADQNNFFFGGLASEEISEQVFGEL